MGITFRALLSARALAPGHSIPLTAAWVWGTNGVNKSSLAGVCQRRAVAPLCRLTFSPVRYRSQAIHASPSQSAAGELPPFTPPQ
ncbi:hypothetical protein [Rothia nasimurium]|uniref:hypothetical protein n=1 Tax=Rothia nasimurium TaxID=85336 RepID=UPI00117B90D2|nr:hypothetical protein [Rothia nasimurium]